MKTQLLAMIASTAILLIGCDNPQNSMQESDDVKPVQQLKKETPKVKQAATQANSIKVEKKSYTIDEIYNKMCIECHSSDGSGNTEKLTPSMRGMGLATIKDALKDVEEDEGHIIMQHNREKIIEMGMTYDATEMAEYMYDRFKE